MEMKFLATYNLLGCSEKASSVKTIKIKFWISTQAFSVQFPFLFFFLSRQPNTESHWVPNHQSSIELTVHFDNRILNSNSIKSSRGCETTKWSVGEAIMDCWAIFEENFIEEHLIGRDWDIRVFEGQRIRRWKNRSAWHGGQAEFCSKHSSYGAFAKALVA